MKSPRKTLSDNQVVFLIIFPCLTFNEHISLVPNQSFRDLLDVLNYDLTYRVLGQWFQM